MNPTNSAARRTFEGLDWMRFCLACYIMLAHTLPSYGYVSGNPAVLRLIQQGNLCTSAFFLLSGFLLAHVYLASGKMRALDRRDFLVMRMSALYPLHLFTFVLVLPIAFFSRYASGRLVLENHTAGTYRIMDWPETVANIVNHLTLTHAWNPFYMVFNVPSWSISALLFFYIVFCFAGLPLYRTTRPVLWLFLLALAFALPEAVAWLFTDFGTVTEGVLHRNPLVRLPLFLAGVVLCSLYVRRGTFDDAGRTWFWPLLGFVAAVFAVEYSFNGSDGETWVRTPFVTQLNLPAALALIAAMTMVRSAPGGWRARWSARLGKASLSIFVLHLPLHRYIAKGERSVTEWLAATPWGAAHGIAGGAAYDPLPWLYPLYFVAIVALCVVFQERVANPIQAWVKRRFIAGRRSTGGAIDAKPVAADPA